MEMNCYPTESQINTFVGTMTTGTVYRKGSTEYDNMVIMKNTRVTKYPDIIVIVFNIHDVQKAVLFAREHNLKIVVQSSGHDFQGRSTADDSFMIHLGGMRNIEVKTTKIDRSPAGEIVLESGTPWVDVYREVLVYNENQFKDIGFATACSSFRWHKFLSFRADDLYFWLIFARMAHYIESHMNITDQVYLGSVIYCNLIYFTDCRKLSNSYIL